LVAEAQIQCFVEAVQMFPVVERFVEMAVVGQTHHHPEEAEVAEIGLVVAVAEIRSWSSEMLQQ
jgi:hypothetical protein